MNAKVIQNRIPSDRSQTASPRPVDRRAFRIGIICALVAESDTVEALFDFSWDDRRQPPYGKAPGDPNIYSTGRIGHHNTVLVHMPGMGKKHASVSAAGLRASFPNVGLVLLVGICGAVPASPSSRNEVIMGDVMVSKGVVQYDLGPQFNARAPDGAVSAAVARLQSGRGREYLMSRTAIHLKTLQTLPQLRAEYPGARYDRLFHPSYTHLTPRMTCEECGCNGPTILSHALQTQTLPPPSIHFGLIASGDTVMKSAAERDAIAKREGVVAFEMEGAGIWDELFPSVVIKGAADYADSHKSKAWQRYAAATAAACAKAFLETWQPTPGA